jgi:hypothetical protein
MAASNVASESPNRVSGKVLLKETGVGIPDLLVVIYDLDPGTRPEEEFGGRDPDGVIPSPPHLGDRLGSILTATDGSWSLEYQDREFRILNEQEKRPDLQLMVLGPEDADSNEPAMVLFSSKITRVNSGRLEAAVIRIASDQLAKAKIKIPVEEHDHHDAETTVDRFRSARRAQRALRTGYRQVHQELDAEEKEEKKEFRRTIENLIVSDLPKVHPSINVVRKGQTIEEVQNQVFAEGTTALDGLIRSVNAPGGDPSPGKGIKVHLTLTDDDLSALRKYQIDGKDYYEATDAQLQSLLFKRVDSEDINSILFADNPISKFCIQKTTEQKCARLHTGLPMPEHDDEHGTGTDPAEPTPPPPPLPQPLTKQDIPLFLAGVLANKESGPFPNPGDYKSQRPDGNSVQANVDSFSLQKGPADTTAFYDFHSLQIAFPYVWQQLLDETLVNLSEKIDGDLENAGRKGILGLVRDRVAAAQGWGHHVLVAAAAEASLYFSQTVPSDISAAFDISFVEYDALNSDDKTKLLAIAQDVNAKELSPRFATYASIRREQGEKIIDNIRINKPFATNSLLKELQERLLSRYEFTVFAANKDYHSVNFGLLNTFRQKWEPISYQAGKLVKTIPLSPKEERKYSAKITQNLKVTKKEAIKNNSSLQNEVSTTSRAESEIVAKAHDKSNFNMSVKLDYSRISSQVGFSKDAQKDTSQSKKDFREAVIKAAQEYKEERSIEVDTEQSLGSEYTETGTIVNPNDELSLTCLFYELQRRYRVSEQLYRVMPVVLVAQQVPAPNEITEAWIVAHDWILNRVLLDDSFRSTLQYIAQKNVGDDFSIRELRKNLRHQRVLVNNLQIEFSKLKHDVENKYAAMERAIRERINEEHIKRTTTWWDHLWDEKERPDPEMAKALEQAATDEHKYAIEKAEKLALSVQREVNALQQMTADYNRTMQEHLDRIAQVRRLLAHFKNNILYYMQAIWSMEPPDQRYMRLYKVLVPQFEATRTCVVEGTPADDIFASFRAPGKQKYTAWLYGAIKRTPTGEPDVTYKQLVEVADINTVLGFKANCIIFPLKQHNALTQFMAAPYVDEAFGAMDPDELSNVSLEEFSKYICCLHDEHPEEFDRLKPVLKAWLERLLSDPLRNGDEVVIPSGSLFIELLPSDKSLLEDFKLKHREWDVYKVQAEVRKLELENIRYAARLLDERMGDPDIDKKIVLAAGAQPVIDVDDP